MAQDTTPAIIVYQGDGSNSVFDVPFDKGYYGEIKVLFVRRGLADYTYQPNTFTVSGRLYAWQNGGAKIYTHTPNPAIGVPTYNSSDVEQAETVSAIAGQTITVDSLVYSRAVQHDISSNMKLTWTGDMLEVGDFICIVRDTERGQPYEMPNNQKHIERALDNIERQVQEVKDATDNALKIDPSHDIPDSHKMNPIDWMKSIIRCMDFSVRALRYSNGWLDYSLDDPNVADADKTWVHLLNTDNIKAVRERSRIEDGETIYWTEYLAQDGSWKTLSDPHKWDNMKLSDLADTDFTNLSAGNFIMFDGLKWKNVYSSATASWGAIIGNITAQTDLMNKFTEYVRTDGSSTMTGVLKMRATSSFQCAIAPFWDGVGFYKLNSDDSVTLIASIEDPDGFVPWVTNTYNIGSSLKKWKNLYLAGKAYVSVINNGYDIAIPNDTGTMALTKDIKDGTLTITQGGQTKGTFKANQDTDTTIDIDAINTDLSNLSSVGQNIGNWSSNVSNCITEIPQDIKLELNAGVLTLKAGSKVYVPNGVGVFDVVTIANDLSTTDTGSSVFVFYDVDSQVLRIRDITNSGTSDPQTPGTAYYDTGNNIINYYTMAGVKSQASFPLCIITGKNIGGVDTTVSIDQIFNGLGYIGSTVFALPGVKLLHPNGRNIDGTLNNTTTTVQNVIVTPGILFTPSSDLCINNSGTEIKYMNPTLSFYNNSDNVYYAAGDINRYDWTLAGKVLFNTNPTSITSLLPKTPFHAVDYGDTEYIAHQAMPSNKYVDLTLGGSGTSYTAPADGYFMLLGTSTAVAGWCALQNTVTLLTHNPSAVYYSRGVNAFLPAKKGDSVRATYGDFTATYFRFVYAQGAQ